MGVLVGMLKLAGAAVALAAVRVAPGWPRRPLQLLGWRCGGLRAAGPTLGLEWTVVVAGLVGAPLLLGLLLAVAPAILGRLGLLPT